MRTDNTFLKILVLLCLAGILVSGWLLSTHIRFATGQAGLTEGCTAIMGLGGSDGCANIAVSQYSDIFGIPLAAIAMGFYFSLLFLVIMAWRSFQTALEPLHVGFLLSTISIFVTILMFTISKFIVKSFCLGCAMLWLINLAIWPAMVKQLQLSWAEALGSLLEIVRPKNLKLRRERLVSSFSISIATVVVCAVIGFAAKSQGGSEARIEEGSLVKEFADAKQMFLPAEAMGGNTSKGSDKPIMEIVKFSDFQCPGCKVAAQFLRAFVRKHGEKVRVTYRNFPLDGSCNSFVPNGGHRFACSASRASLCAAKEGKFWDMHDKIFDAQDSLSLASLDEFAGLLGLNMDSFGSCLKDPSVEALLQKDILWGDQIQLESTPTLIINGRKLSGAKSPQELEALLLSLEKAK